MAKTRAQWLLNAEEAIVTEPAQKMVERLGDEIASQMAKLGDQLKTQAKQALSAMMETRGLIPSPNQASQSFDRPHSLTLPFRSHLELPSSHHLEPGGGRRSPISTNQPIPEKIEAPSLKHSSTANTTSRLVPLKYSGEEVWERMGNGLCIFCEEKDSPAHQLKHKRLRIVVMECDDHSFDEELVVDTCDLLMSKEEEALESVVAIAGEVTETNPSAKERSSSTVIDVHVTKVIHEEEFNTEKKTYPLEIHQMQAIEKKVSNSLLEPDQTMKELQSGLLANYSSLDDLGVVVSSSLSCGKRVGTAELQTCISKQANHVWEPGGLVYPEIQTRWLERVDNIGVMQHCVPDLQVGYVSVIKTSFGVEFYELEYKKLPIECCFEVPEFYSIHGSTDDFQHLAFDPGGTNLYTACDDFVVNRAKWMAKDTGDGCNNVLNLATGLKCYKSRMFKYKFLPQDVSSLATALNRSPGESTGQIHLDVLKHGLLQRRTQSLVPNDQSESYSSLVLHVLSSGVSSEVWEAHQNGKPYVLRVEEVYVTTLKSTAGIDKEIAPQKFDKKVHQTEYLTTKKKKMKCLKSWRFKFKQKQEHAVEELQVADSGAVHVLAHLLPLTEIADHVLNEITFGNDKLKRQRQEDFLKTWRFRFKHWTRRSKVCTTCLRILRRRQEQGLYKQSKLLKNWRFKFKQKSGKAGFSANLEVKVFSKGKDLIQENRVNGCGLLCWAGTDMKKWASSIPIKQVKKKKNK